MSVGTLDVVAWQYDADRHCPDCYRERFDSPSSVETDGLVTVLEFDAPAADSEGNPPHPMTDSDVYGCMFDALEDAYGAGLDGDLLVAWATLNCGSCHTEIDSLGADVVTETVRRWREDAAGH